MIPELSHMNCVNIYECVSFPEKWIFRKSILVGGNADNVVFKYNGLYWLINQMFDGVRYNLCIHYAEKLLGKWTPHKQVNINNKIINEHTTRGAGAVIRLENKLIRVAQYSRNGNYGEGIIFYEIKLLTPTQYHEVPIHLLTTRHLDDPTKRNIHTFYLCGELAVFDVRSPHKTDVEIPNINIPLELALIEEKNLYSSFSQKGEEKTE